MKGLNRTLATAIVGLVVITGCCPPVTVTQGATQCEVRQIPGSDSLLVVQCQVAVVTRGKTTDTSSVVASDTIPDPNP